MLIRIRLLIALLMMMLAHGALAFEAFVIKDIRVEGLERIDTGTVFNYLPVSVGERIDQATAAKAVHALFKTGFFNDVQLFGADQVLIVSVKERPAIGEIKISGNKDITTEDLNKALKNIGLAEGRIFDRSLLDKVERELENQYYSRGKYGVKIDSEIKDLERNRVAINIVITEGDVAKISNIIITGNKAYSDKELLAKIQLTTPSLLAFWSSNDEYAKQKLAGDLETIRSFYLDHGYINFNINSTQVSISPDRKSVYITINVTEGEKHVISDYSLAGELIVPEQELRALIKIKKGDTFSRKSVSEAAASISERLGKEGYAFANVNTIPDVDDENNTVKLTFYLDPSKRVYVRRINISGNMKTHDEVLRRELRQMESGWISTERVNRSRVRLQRLGYFDDVNIETPPVSGTTDQVDLNVDVKERTSFGSLMAGVGYSDAQGLLFNASVTQDNFLGTGKRVSARFDNSKVNTIYSFSYLNPYYTMDGISRGFKVFFRQTDAGNANVASYLSDSYGASMNFGIPVNEYDTTRFSLSYENTLLKATSSTPYSYSEFINQNPDYFPTYKVTLDWSHDTRNKTFFPESGLLESLSLESSIPGSEYDYYKLSNQTSWYFPLTEDLTFSLSAEIAYGEAYGDTERLPFYEHYYAGGVRSVRGYRANTLGPKECFSAPVAGVCTSYTMNAGGTLRTLGGAELIFPPPFFEKNNSFRLSAFVDVGNVYDKIEDFEASELRYSSGLAAVWLSPIGPLTFSFSRAFNYAPADEREIFQFSVGAAF